MYYVPDSFVPRWQNDNRVMLPIAVDLICPHCGQKVSFSMQWGGANETIMTTSSRCPRCQKLATFILVDILQVDGKDEKRGELYVYPSPKVRYPISGIDEPEEFPNALNRAYASAINVYNVGEWTATAVLCRRLLEGIAKTLLPEEKQKLSLFKQLEAMPEYRDLKKPILTLADAIRKGGNLGAHFDLEREPNEETTTLMLDLLEYLIEYLFILPKQIDKLHESIDKLGKGTT